MERLMNKTEVCEILAISKPTLDRILADGELPSLRIRGQIRIQESDLKDYLRRCQISRSQRMKRSATKQESVPQSGRRRRKKDEAPIHYFPGMRVV